MSPRLLRLLLALFPIVTAAFALYQLFLFGLALRARSWPIAGLYLVMGIAGLAITSAVRRTTKHHAQQTPPR